jgi:hypothetical protein
MRKFKFPTKVLLWLAVSDYGLGEPVIFKSGLAVNKKLYITKHFKNTTNIQTLILLVCELRTRYSNENEIPVLFKQKSIVFQKLLVERLEFKPILKNLP